MDIQKGDWNDALRRARIYSPFLAQALDRQPELEALLSAGDGEGALAFARSAGAECANIGISLRRERLALATALAIGDLAGIFPLADVMVLLSDFADRALDRAIAAAIERRVPDASPAGFTGLALGKHGAQELNYSSDIDPILLYDPETLPRRERDEPGEAAQRYAREIVRLLSETTEEGYVFRTDLRLRPASEVSSLALSFSAALTHYESSALAWERAAFIRARAASGDIEEGEHFLTDVRPFVWRRSLDFGAIEEISRLTVRIRENYAGPLEPGPGFNVKQGRGGIREVEFFAQTHQLIHGGRNPSLRQRGTRAALDALAQADIISEDNALALGDAYDGLRIIEHRLQMVHDRQTHSLPEGEAMEDVARLAGFEHGQAMLDHLAKLTETVAAHFDNLISPESTASESGAKAIPLEKELAQYGFSEPAKLAKRIGGWTDGRLRAIRSAEAISAFEALRPALLAALAEAPDPDKAVLRWERLLTNASSAINLFRLLEARPGLLDQLLAVLTLSDPLAEELALRPELLDILIDRSALDLPGSVEELRQSMMREEPGDDYEQHLDRLRIVTGESRFAMGVQLATGAADPLDIGRGLARLAEAGVQTAAARAGAEFAAVHGNIADSELIVVGLGRLGGGLLSHASDLDMVYMFTGSHEQESDGDRQLGATLYYNRLAQRVSGALSVPTSAGALYEVDTRLRPQGNQGPLATSLESFRRYQIEDAWTWELMALTRARPLVGSADDRKEFAAARDAALYRERDPVQLSRDVLSMRAEMAEHKPAGGPLDIKLLRGGLVDCEFLVHYLQLRDQIAFDPDLGEAISQLAESGLVRDGLQQAHDQMTRLLIATRLLAPGAGLPPAQAAARLASLCQEDDFDSLLQSLLEARQCVAENWNLQFDQKLEIT